MESIDKVKRVLSIYDELLEGHIVNKTIKADEFGVNTRTLQRDIDDIRSYLAYRGAEKGIVDDIVYDRKEKGFHLGLKY